MTGLSFAQTTQNGTAADRDDAEQSRDKPELDDAAVRTRSPQVAAPASVLDLSGSTA
jgi:hypothetical protein